MWGSSTPPRPRPPTSLPSRSTGENYAANYTVTVLNQAPHQAGAEAFVNYLLGPEAKPALNADGFTLVTPPKVTGTGVPAGLQSILTP